MAYAELGSAFHDAGGGYLWVKTSLPDPNGFLTGWMSWFAHAVACSLYALGFGAYFRLVLEVGGRPSFHLVHALEKWLAVVACALFAYINFRGASETGKAGNVVTIGKIVVIGAFIVAGLWSMARRPGWQASFTPFMTTAGAACSRRWDSRSSPSRDTRSSPRPARRSRTPSATCPRAVFLSLLIVIPIYLLVALRGDRGHYPPAGHDGDGVSGGSEKEIALVTAADQFMAGGGIVILVGGLLSTLSALNATIYSSSRVAFAMARDANLPPVLARCTSAGPRRTSRSLLGGAHRRDGGGAADRGRRRGGRHHVPAAVRAGERRRDPAPATRPDLDRGFRVPFMPVIPILAIATMLFLAVFLFIHYPLAWVAAGGWIALGVVVYYGYSRKREAALERDGVDGADRAQGVPRAGGDLEPADARVAHGGRAGDRAGHDGESSLVTWRRCRRARR